MTDSSFTLPDEDMEFSVSVSSVGTLYIRLDFGESNFVLWDKEFQKLITLLPQMTEGVQTPIFREAGYLEYPLSKTKFLYARKMDVDLRPVNEGGIDDTVTFYLEDKGKKGKVVEITQAQWDGLVRWQDEMTRHFEKARAVLTGKKRKLEPKSSPNTPHGGPFFYQFSVLREGLVVYTDPTYHQKKAQCAASAAVKAKSLGPDVRVDIVTYRVKKRGGAQLMHDLLKLYRQKTADKIKQDRLASLFTMCHNEILQWGMNPYGTSMAECALLMMPEGSDEDWQPASDDGDDYAHVLSRWLDHMITVSKVSRRKTLTTSSPSTSR